LGHCMVLGAAGTGEVMSFVPAASASSAECSLDVRRQ
jgi:hypothetical protein